MAHESPAPYGSKTTNIKAGLGGKLRSAKHERNCEAKASASNSKRASAKAAARCHVSPSLLLRLLLPYRG